MSNSVAYRWSRVFLTGGAIIGTGILLFKYTVPTDEELIFKFSPEIRQDYEHNRSLRQKEQEELMKVVKETSSSSNPIWMTGKIKSPFEKDGRHLSPQLVDAELFQKSEGENYKKEQLQEAQKLVDETIEMSKPKKGWFSWR